MDESKKIIITNGVGTLELVNGTYTISASTLGYDNTSILPVEQEITEGVDTYNFTIGATGTLTLHVTEDATAIGTPVVGATFIRCDGEGTTYGEVITTDQNGNAVFNNVPYLEGENAPVIYYKQTKSDISHTFDDTLKNTTLTTATTTLEVANQAAVERTFNLTDVNYDGLPIVNGEITLS